MILLYLLPAVFFGWSLGANASCASFGPSVGSGLMSHRKAIIIGAIFVVLGAVLGGAPGLRNIGSLAKFSVMDASCALLSAAFVVTTMTWLKLPASASQAIIGAIIGIGAKSRGITGFEWSDLVKFFTAWILTPFTAMFISFLLYFLLSHILKKFRRVQYQDFIIRTLGWVAGIYGVYSLGANNVANVTGVFVGNLLSIRQAALIGGLSIALGILTFSSRVMITVGRDLVRLDHFSSVIAVLAQSVTVWIFSLVGIPVAATQAIVGSVIGAGFARGERLNNPRIVYKVVAGWTQVPVAAGVLSYFLKNFFEIMASKA